MEKREVGVMAEREAEANAHRRPAHLYLLKAKGVNQSHASLKTGAAAEAGLESGAQLSAGPCSVVPQVVQSCAEFIEQHGVVQGIYRLSGVASKIQKLR